MRCARATEIAHRRLAPEREAAKVSAMRRPTQAGICALLGAEFIDDASRARVSIVKTNTWREARKERGTNPKLKTF
jgi:hypothetical protein